MPELMGKLRTEQGARTVYDAVSQCSRCGYCEQACPTYVITGKEHFSGRGRNQLVRMLTEDKFKAREAAKEALSTCLLCGACTSACYAHVPTADLVLEGRRMLRGPKIPWLVRVLRWFLEDHEELFGALLKCAYAAKRWGLARLLVSTRLLRLFGLSGFETAAVQVEEVPGFFLYERLRKRSDLHDMASARWGYFAPCGPNYLLPQVGLATVDLLGKKLGPGLFLDNPCCGLLFYNYGDLDAARRLARRNIENFEAKLFPPHALSIPDPYAVRASSVPSNTCGRGEHEGEKRCGKNGRLVFGDCSSCVAHLKSYPQLFMDDPIWAPRAERFASRVRDIIELQREIRSPACNEENDEGPFRGSEGVNRGNCGSKTTSSAETTGIVTLHDSCRARHGQGIAEEPRQMMREKFGANYAEIPEAGWCCGGAGAFAFTHAELSDEVLKRKVAHIASIQARSVATSSTSCLLQLAHGLRKYYPDCTVAHVSELWNQEQG